MIPKKALEIVHRSSRDLCFSEIFSRNKLIILREDFRQILPVIKNRNRSTTEVLQ